MNKTLKTYTFQVLAVMVLGFLVGFSSQVSAQTYFVDITGNGCNASCQQLISQYFSSTSTNTGTSSTYNATTTTSTSTPSQSRSYPYLQYTNFQSTNDYYRNNGNVTGSNPYAYRSYTYFNNPAPTYQSNYSYPNSFYTYYGSDANAQLQRYQQAPSFNQYRGNGYQSQYSLGYQQYPNRNAGFTMTSGF
ncbi:MAG: hypothetical protein FGM57_00090 [Candidatus Taylorbacteria bacterium]|nr:hypothetical protein [Candidatus Taylorbacteria bacterium]